MADLIGRILTGIGALTVLAAAVLSAIAWMAWRRDQRARNKPLPPLSPEQHRRLLADLEAFEEGERP